MEVKDGSEVVLSVADLKALVKEHVEKLKPEYRVVSVQFPVRTSYDGADWNGPPDYVLGGAEVKMVKR